MQAKQTRAMSSVRMQESLKMGYSRTISGNPRCWKLFDQPKILETRNSWILGLSILAITLSTQAGCRSWQGMPFQASTRVPPPSTGSFQGGGDYYNGNAAAAAAAAPGVAPASATMSPPVISTGTSAATSSAAPGVQDATFTTPSFAAPPSSGAALAPTNLSAPSATSATGAPGTAVGAGMTITPTSSGQYTADAYGGVPASASLSDGATADPPSLGWR